VKLGKKKKESRVNEPDILMREGSKLEEKPAASFCERVTIERGERRRGR